MTTYIAIEHNSGYVWGFADAETAERACDLINRKADHTQPEQVWERVNPIRDTDGGYHLHLLIDPASDFPALDEIDGRDEATIDWVSALPHVGDYRPIEVGE
jgi:hypothetical protein